MAAVAAVDKGTQFLTVGRISENIRETPEGFIVCEGVPITRAGDFLYGPGELRRLDGEAASDTTDTDYTTVRRRVEDIHDPVTIASFNGKPVTIGHPDAFVTPENFRQLVIGVVQNVRPGEGPDADKLVADLLIQDREAIDAIRAGKLREVSCGYRFEFEQLEPGLARLKGIIGNHVALVSAGRCGPACAIKDQAMENAMKPSLLARLTARFGKKEVEELIAADEATPDPAPEKPAVTLESLAARMDMLEKGGKEAAPSDPPPAPEKPAAGAEADPEAKPEPTMADLARQVETLAAAVSKLVAGSSSPTPNAQDAGMCKDAATIAMAEILAPGIPKTADVKAKALDAAYTRTDGRAVIDGLLEGTGKTFATCDREVLFPLAAKSLHLVRRATLAAAQPSPSASATDGAAGPMTTDKLNEINAAHYKGVGTTL